MRDRCDSKPSSRRVRAPGRDGKVEPKRGAILGLEAFDKISAVEGIGLSDAMREDLARVTRSGMEDHERSRFIMDRYGKE